MSNIVFCFNFVFSKLNYIKSFSPRQFHFDMLGHIFVPLKKKSLANRNTFLTNLVCEITVCEELVMYSEQGKVNRTNKNTCTNGKNFDLLIGLY